MNGDNRLDELAASLGHDLLAGNPVNQEHLKEYRAIELAYTMPPGKFIPFDVEGELIKLLNEQLTTHIDRGITMSEQETLLNKAREVIGLHPPIGCSNERAIVWYFENLVLGVSKGNSIEWVDLYGQMVDYLIRVVEALPPRSPLR